MVKRKSKGHKVIKVGLLDSPYYRKQLINIGKGKGKAFKFLTKIREDRVSDEEIKGWLLKEFNELLKHLRKEGYIIKKANTKPKKKKPSKYDLMLRRMESDSQKAIKRCSCKRCGGVIVTDYASSLMASSRKRCECKKPLR